MSAIAYEDYIAEPGSSWAPGFGADLLDITPLDRALSPQLGFAWVANGFAGGPRTIVRELAGERPIDVIALLDVRFSSTLQVAAQTGPGAAIFPTTPITTYPSGDFVRNFFFLLPERINVFALLMQFLAPSGSTYSVGRIWAGPLFEPPVGIERDWELSMEDPGDKRPSRGRQMYARRGQRYRTARLNLSAVPRDQAFGLPDHTVLDLQQLAYRLGTTDPCIVLPRTRTAEGEFDVHAIHRLGFYGGLQRPMRIQHAGGPYFRAQLEAEEWL
jgi:hypothetical protein